MRKKGGRKMIRQVGSRFGWANEGASKVKIGDEEFWITDTNPASEVDVVERLNALSDERKGREAATVALTDAQAKVTEAAAELDQTKATLVQARAHLTDLQSQVNRQRDRWTQAQRDVREVLTEALGSEEVDRDVAGKIAEALGIELTRKIRIEATVSVTMETEVDIAESDSIDADDLLSTALSNHDFGEIEDWSVESADWEYTD